MTTAIDHESLVRSAEEHGNRYIAAFNSGDLAVIDAMYTEDAISVWEPGNPLSGDARREALAEFIAQRPTMTATLRESHVTGTAALLVVDWAIDLPLEDGGTEHLEGVGLDVLRMGPDGNWRFAVDNPFGTDA